MITEEEAAFAPIGPWRGYGRYQGALVLPVDAAGRVLLQLRDRSAPIHPGEWGCFGGGVEAGESLRAAAVRELAEETGLVVGESDLTPFARLVAPRTGARLYLFEAGVDAAPSDIRLGEGAGFGFFEARDIAALPLLAATRLFLAAWLRARRSP